ncbi:hypothetical protein EYF80_025002 [Liparis tanakae]|uniref:Uncharacterized protein n=1 Tax=Liparis tanakae TaxID=230148 RepID=A0A4Z2HG07_9TELE|nr:hypothetical protein EYF80_025002 [Liparis tanakae]
MNRVGQASPNGGCAAGFLAAELVPPTWSQTCNKQHTTVISCLLSIKSVCGCPATEGPVFPSDAVCSLRMIRQRGKMGGEVINHKMGKSSCSFCFMEEVQLSIPSPPLPTLNLYYRCKADSTQLKVSSETLRAAARSGVQ